MSRPCWGPRNGCACRQRKTRPRMNRLSLRYPTNKIGGAIKMFTNGDNNSKGNGRKRVPFTRMTDMGVEVIDKVPAGERAEDEEKRREAEIADASEGKTQPLLDESDAPASAE